MQESLQTSLIRYFTRLGAQSKKSLFWSNLNKLSEGQAPPKVSLKWQASTMGVVMGEAVFNEGLEIVGQ